MRPNAIRVVASGKIVAPVRRAANREIPGPAEAFAPVLRRNKYLPRRIDPVGDLRRLR